MTRSFLVRGMLAGVIAGLLVFAFSRWLGEPQVERAIAFETSMEHASGEAPEPEMVSRGVQRGIGLLTAVVVEGVAVGGLFGLAFACIYGRFGIADPRGLSALLAGFAFLATAVVPNLKYPANPPSVGNPASIGIRTASFFLLIACSIAAIIFAIQIARRLAVRYGTWNGYLLGAAFYVVIIGVILHFFPDFDEVPPGFPATLIWRFRITALEIQAVMWLTVGLLFGWLTSRKNQRPLPFIRNLTPDVDQRQNASQGNERQAG